MVRPRGLVLPQLIARSEKLKTASKEKVIDKLDSKHSYINIKTNETYTDSIDNICKIVGCSVSNYYRVKRLKLTYKKTWMFK